jgi:hypothetical protein
MSSGPKQAPSGAVVLASAKHKPGNNRRIDSEGSTLAELQQQLGAAAPWIVAAYAVIVLVAMVTLWRLSRQWQRHQVSAAGRIREMLALALITGVALALTAYASRHVQEQQDAQRLQAELRERDRIAKVLQTRIATEIDAVRTMLADRTVRNIERDTLVQARNELARFAELKDPRIIQMLSLIDTELQIRTLVEQSLAETAPGTLAQIFARLAALAPDNAEYRDQAARYAAEAATAGK